MNIDQKIPVAQYITSALAALAGKVNFADDQSLVHAMRLLEEQGIPTAKHEEYKYCNIEAILKKEFKNISNRYTAIDSSTVQQLANVKDCINLFVVNGRFIPEYSNLDQLPEKLLVGDIKKVSGLKELNGVGAYADVTADAFIALNCLYGANGVFIHAESGFQAQKPVHIIYVNSVEGNTLENIRNYVQVEAEAELQLIESFVSINNAAHIFSNYLSEIVMRKGSKLIHTKIQNEDKSSYQVNTTQVHQQQQSNYTSNTFTFGGAVVRNNLNVVMDAKNAEAHLNGLFIASQTALIDNHTLVDHRQPHCNSNELYKGVISDKATGVFNGKIFVRKDAQKTNAYQSSKNILLSDEATINTKPQLEIYADDVKCSHGTSTGKIDEEAVFYLKSRGIGELAAKRLLLQAFAGEVVEKIEHPALKEKLEDLLLHNMQ